VTSPLEAVWYMAATYVFLESVKFLVKDLIPGLLEFRKWMKGRANGGEGRERGSRRPDRPSRREIRSKWNDRMLIDQAKGVKKDDDWYLEQAANEIIELEEREM